MRQKGVEKMFRDMGYERGAYHVCMKLAEEVSELQSLIKECAKSIGALSTVITMQNTVADAMKEKIDDMSRHFDDPRSTHAIVRSSGTDED